MAEKDANSDDHGDLIQDRSSETHEAFTSTGAMLEKDAAQRHQELSRFRAQCQAIRGEAKKMRDKAEVTRENAEKMRADVRRMLEKAG